MDIASWMSLLKSNLHKKHIKSYFVFTARYDRPHTRRAPRKLPIAASRYDSCLFKIGFKNRRCHYIMWCWVILLSISIKMTTAFRWNTSPPICNSVSQQLRTLKWSLWVAFSTPNTIWVNITCAHFIVYQHILMSLNAAPFHHLLKKPSAHFKTQCETKKHSKWRVWRWQGCCASLRQETIARRKFRSSTSLVAKAIFINEIWRIWGWKSNVRAGRMVICRCLCWRYRLISSIASIDVHCQAAEARIAVHSQVCMLGELGLKLNCAATKIHITTILYNCYMTAQRFSSSIDFEDVIL